jgi:hypothetical protein
VPGTRSIGLATALAALAVTLGACGGDDDEATTTPSTTSTEAVDETGESHIDLSTGESQGLAPDERVGTAPTEDGTQDLEAVADAAGCELQLDLPEDGSSGNLHIPASQTPRYTTEPPNSGEHDDVPLADGAYLETPDDRYFVHSMEHGRVAVEYQPTLAEEDQLALKGLIDSDPDGMLLFPYEEMPYEVAATAWTNVIGCDSFGPDTVAAIQAFRDEFRGNGPEAIPL